MSRGRKSKTRKRIATILSQLRTSYGYKIYKIYQDAFETISKRTIYYHLNKGVDKGEFVIANVITREGDFTWGSKTRRTYYALGPRAKLAGVNNEQINKIQKYSPSRIEVDWESIVENKIEEIKGIRESIEGRKEKIKFRDRIKELKEWIRNKLNKEGTKKYLELLRGKGF